MVVSAESMCSQKVSVAAQPDGKVVAAGQVRSAGQPSNIAVVRHLGDGGADLSFGDAGVVLTSYPGRDAYGRSIVLDPTGKIVVAGFSEDAVDPTASADYEVVRYNADGTPDPTFGFEVSVMAPLAVSPNGGGFDKACSLTLTPARDNT